MDRAKIYNHQLKKHKCELCDYRADSKARVGQHMRLHSEERPFACSLPGCSFRTKYPQGVKDHEPRHDPVLSTRYKCTICSKAFATDYQLERHVRVHTQEKHKKCPHCDFKTVNITGLISHQKKVHGIGKVGKRSQASKYKPASSIYVKIEFKELWLQDGRTVYKCLFPGCDYLTKSKTCILVHRRTVHNPRHIVCTFPGCEMKFKTPFSFRSHLTSHDLNRQRNHRCPLCSEKFSGLAGLKRHVKSHTGERVYQCPFCDYESNENSNVYRHVRQHHPNDWIPGTPLVRNQNVQVNSLNTFLLKCSFCEFVAEGENRLLKHSVKHRRLTVSIERIRHCSHCATYRRNCGDCMLVNGLNVKTARSSREQTLGVPAVILERIYVSCEEFELSPQKFSPLPKERV